MGDLLVRAVNALRDYETPGDDSTPAFEPYKSELRALHALEIALSEGWILDIVNAPTGAEAEGARYLVGVSPEGVFVNNKDCLAVLVDDVWHFSSPSDGLTLFNRAIGKPFYYRASVPEWQQLVANLADLGTAATHDAGDFEVAGAAAQAEANAIAASDPVGSADAVLSSSLQKASNLSDIGDVLVARGNIGAASASDVTALTDATLISKAPVENTANTPDVTPTVGMRRLIGTSPTGAWAGKENQVAEYFAGGWHYSGLPTIGLIVGFEEGAQYVFDGANWRLWTQIDLATRYMTIPGVLRSESGSDLTLEAQGSAKDIVLKWGGTGRVSFGNQAGNFYIDYDTDPDYGGARFVTEHSGNVVCVRNASGADDCDSAIMFKDGLAGRSGSGTEVGAIGFHTGLNYPFENGFFIEASNDPILGVSDLAPVPLRLIQTGKLPGLTWGARKRIELSSDGWTRFYDGQLNEAQVEVMRIPPKWPDDLIYIRGFKTSTGGDGHGYFGADAGIVGELVRVAGATTWAMSVSGKLGDTASNALFLTLGGDRTADGAYSVFNYVDGDGAGTQRAQLLANGAFYGNGTFGTLSDKRLKHDRGPMGSVAKKFGKLDFHAYQMKSDIKAMGRRAPIKYGIFAQQAKPLFPHLIDEFIDHGKTRLRADYMALSVVTARALQETMSEVEALRRELRALRRN